MKSGREKSKNKGYIIYYGRNRNLEREKRTGAKRWRGREGRKKEREEAKNGGMQGDRKAGM